MASETFNSDLRRAGTEAKRYYDRKAKWAHGGRCALPRQNLKPPFLPLTRPAKRGLNHYVAKVSNQHNLNKLARYSQIALSYDIRDVFDSDPSDSSTGEEVRDPVVVETVQDTGDHLHRPYEVSGQTVLSDAVSKAVEKFETKETEKLVREYEVVTHESEMGGGYLADDDFELIDHARL